MHVTPVCKIIQLYFDFDLLFHNHFISTTAFGWGYMDSMLCPSTLMQMFHKSEIVLVEYKKTLRRAFLRGGVNDIWIKNRV